MPIAVISRGQKGANKNEEEKKGSAQAQVNNFVLTDSDEVSDDDDEMNMSAFMREGGLDEDIANQKQKAKEAEEERKRKEEQEKQAEERKKMKSGKIWLDSLE